MLFHLKKIIYTMRKFALSPFNKNFVAGKNFKVGKRCFISRKNSIIIGNNFYMGNNCHLSSNLKIGDDVLLASYVSFVGGDHKIDNIETTFNRSGRDKFRTTVIEDNVWIGHGAIILHGVKIESGSVIAAGSIVTKDVDKNSIFGGNPAKLIKKIKD